MAIVSARKAASMAKPIDEYKGKCTEGKAFQVMIDNNLDFEVALYPYELVTYGETGSVCHDWMQYLLIKRYLEEMTQDQTLVMESGHPLGLFRSKPEAPRVIISNGIMVGEYDNLHDWEIAEEMGVANYGQMTAGGWMYIGPSRDCPWDLQYDPQRRTYGNWGFQKMGTWAANSLSRAAWAV